MPEPPKPMGKLLRFSVTQPHVESPGGELIKALIASNRELVSVLGRLCDLCTAVLEGEPVQDLEQVMAELRSALKNSARVKGLLNRSGH
jgi:hypothetical protein